MLCQRALTTVRHTIKRLVPSCVLATVGTATPSPRSANRRDLVNTYGTVNIGQELGGRVDSFARARRPKVAIPSVSGPAQRLRRRTFVSQQPVPVSKRPSHHDLSRTLATTIRTGAYASRTARGHSAGEATCTQGEDAKIGMFHSSSRYLRELCSAAATDAVAPSEAWSPRGHFSPPTSRTWISGGRPASGVPFAHRGPN